MLKKRPIRITIFTAFLLLISVSVVFAQGSINVPKASAADETISADDAIVDVTAIGFVDFDGAKLSAIVIEYNIDMTGADVSIDDYTIKDYGIEQGDSACELGSNPGAAVNAYVNDSPAISETGGTGIGTYVIIEVNTDYQLGAAAQTYLWAMYAGVIQTDSITAGSNSITPSETEFKNYYVFERNTINSSTGLPRPTEYRNYALEGKYTILGTEVFELYTKEDGTAFHAEDCWDEATGELTDVDLPYALYVPEDYDPNKEYAIVLHVHDAGSLSDDPMNTLTKARGPINYASPEVQQIAKDQGLGGIIVVAPSISTELRSTRDDYSLSAAVPATWQLMDYLTETYSIDTNRIYGTGQSMGGMQVVAMAAQRDNYFAALLPIGCQWGTNYNLDDPTYNGTPYYAAPADGTIIWTTDADGNPVDYRNWYYILSDDNILALNCKNDSFSYGVWKEFKYLYLDLAGAEIPYTDWNPLTTSVADQNAALRALVAQENDLGIYWGAFEGGNHNATWVYAHRVSAAYEWLFTQTRESALNRDKLPLDRAFELADEQSTDTDRLIASGSASLVTGKLGAGTDGYNSALYGKSGGSLTRLPGWTAVYQTVTFSLYPKRAALIVTDQNDKTVACQADGSYLLLGGDYTYEVTMTNYNTVKLDFTVSDQDLSFDITLQANVELSVYKDLNRNPDTWYLGHVEYSVANNLFIGISNDQWGPNMDLSRAMFVTALGKFEGVDISQYSTCDFTDVDDSLYYTAYTQWAYKEGLVAGVGGGKFDPDRSITRQEMAQIFMVYAEYKGIDITDPDDSAFENFKDKAATSDWAVPAMIWATANGVINGDDGRLKPVDNTTRAEAAAIFRAVIENIL